MQRLQHWYCLQSHIMGVSHQLLADWLQICIHHAKQMFKREPNWPLHEFMATWQTKVMEVRLCTGVWGQAAPCSQPNMSL